MIFISHRGNISRKIKSKENTPLYVNQALKLGFDVEIDVWLKNGEFYLGHDFPKIKINFKYLENKKLWCHAKNIDAIFGLSKIKSKYFWHQKDDVTITSNGYFWTFPGKKLTKKSICVLPEISNYRKIKCAGICSDFIKKYKILYD